MLPLKEFIRQAFAARGYQITRIRQVRKTNSRNGDLARLLAERETRKIHYACGGRIMGDGWINVDIHDPVESTDKAIYICANLVSEHPFDDGVFDFAFSEDFIEHLSQADSLIFLSEAYRTLKVGGILRLSFPGLRGVLRKHYRSSDFSGAKQGAYEAFDLWNHVHFYSQESLATVAEHIGFSGIDFVGFGESSHDELSNLDTRVEQMDLNIYVELTK